MSDADMKVHRGYTFAAVPEWMIYEPTIDDNALRIFAALCRCGEDVYPRLSTIAKRTGKSVDTVRRGIRSLQRAGAVTVEQRFTDGRQCSNHYTLAGDAPLHTRAGRSATPDPGNSASPDPGRSASHKESTKNESTLNESVTTSRAAQTPLIVIGAPFDIFWDAYPRKIGKPAAVKAWKAVNGDRNAQDIWTGLARWVEYWEWRNEAEFVPHPSTWLNQRRWEDETPPRNRKRTNGQASTFDKLRTLQFDDHGNMVG